METKTITIGIIGCAGRGTDIKMLTKQVFEKMINSCKERLDEIADRKHIHLVSGGAAWSDHVAVALYLTGDFEKLTLHLPCDWDSEKCQHVDNGDYSWKTNPGKSANTYHKTFSKITGQNTLKEIGKAIKSGAIVKTHKGFHQRNSFIAKSSYLIAFTTSTGKAPVKGGTLDTWKKAIGQKTHISIPNLINENKKRRLD